VAGASVELSLSASERERLLSLLGARGWRFSPRQRRFYTLVYAAFRAGQTSFALGALDASEPEEVERLERELERYRAVLVRSLPAGDDP
jgi:hypothetical protein